jgi:hypothetical protein
MSLKQKRLEQKKASEISGDTRAWNSFYMRQDTVWFPPIFDINGFFCLCPVSAQYSSDMLFLR